MYNQLTDQYKMVQTEIVKALPIFGRLITAEANQSLVVFWYGEYMGSIPAHNAPTVGINGQKPIKKVKNGYIIYSVSCASFPVSITGFCTTKDHYIRTYKMTLDLMVINPVLFAQGYRLGKDPLNMAVETTRSAFLSYIAQMKHDDLKGWIPEDQFHKRLAMESGMKVTINNPIIQADPKRVKPLATELETDINDLDDIRGEIQKLKDELRKMQEEQEKTYIAGITMNRMKERDTEFERKQEIDRLNHESSKRKLERKNEEAEQIHKLNHQLLETAAQEMAQILQAHIRDTFDSKKSITDIVEDLDEFMKALHGTLLKVTIDDTIDSNNSGAKTNGKSP